MPDEIDLDWRASTEQIKAHAAEIVARANLLTQRDDQARRRLWTATALLILVMLGGFGTVLVRSVQAAHDRQVASLLQEQRARENQESIRRITLANCGPYVLLLERLTPAERAALPEEGRRFYAQIEQSVRDLDCPNAPTG